MNENKGNIALTLNNSVYNFMYTSLLQKYSYNFTWLSRPIIQYPQDIVAIQEIIWRVKPDLIIETGIAHGGSLILSATMLVLLDYCEASSEGKNILNIKHSKRKVLGIDIEIRRHNKLAIESHPLSHMITMLEGSSIDSNIISQVTKIAKNYKKIMVCLDSNHTHDHVLAELEIYAPLVSKDSYCVVFDTIIENMPKDIFPDRPWGPGNNPKTALQKYLETHPEFAIDKDVTDKLLITASPNGYLKRIS